MAYFFDEEELKNLFFRCGFECVRSNVLTPNVVNHKEKKSMDRVFVQVLFRCFGPFLFFLFFVLTSKIGGLSKTRSMKMNVYIKNPK